MKILFDKVKTRSILRELGVPVAAGEVLQSAHERTLSLPVVVKPQEKVRVWVAIWCAMKKSGWMLSQMPLHL